MQNNSLLFLFHIPKTAGTSLRQAMVDKLVLDEGFIHLGPYGDRTRHENGLKPLEQYSARELDRIQVVSGHYLSTDFEKYFPDRDIKRAIILREPATRILSQYNHAMRNRSKLKEKSVDFHTWYEDQSLPHFDWQSLYGHKLTLADKKLAISSVGHNYMSKFILDAMGDRDYPALPDDELLSRTENYLKTFWHIGSMENLSASIEEFEQLLGTQLDVGTRNKTGSFFFSKLTRHMKMNRRLRDYLVEKNSVDYRIYNTCCTRN